MEATHCGRHSPGVSPMEKLMNVIEGSHRIVTGLWGKISGGTRETAVLKAGMRVTCPQALARRLSEIRHLKTPCTCHGKKVCVIGGEDKALSNGKVWKRRKHPSIKEYKEYSLSHLPGATAVIFPFRLSLLRACR